MKRTTPPSAGRLTKFAYHAAKRLLKRDRTLRPVDLKGAPTAAGFAPELLRANYGSPAVTRPALVPALDLAFDPKEPALGVVRDGDARVYPLSSFKHLVNDVIGGRPTVVSFCERCSSGVAFDAEVDSRHLTFTHFGAYRGSFAARDEQTGSVWAQETGEALAGPLAGRRLEPVAVHLTTVGGWLAQHPDSLAPDPAGAPTVARSPLGGALLPPVWKETLGRRDDRLPSRTLVLGVDTGEGTRAYVVDGPLESLLVHCDEIGGVPVVLLGGEGGWPLAYDRRTPDGVVDLSLRNGRIVDGRGTEWSVEGAATAGPLAGAALQFVPSHVVEWYAWAENRPDTEIAHLNVVAVDR